MTGTAAAVCATYFLMSKSAMPVPEVLAYSLVRIVVTLLLLPTWLLTRLDQSDY